MESSFKSESSKKGNSEENIRGEIPHESKGIQIMQRIEYMVMCLFTDLHESSNKALQFLTILPSQLHSAMTEINNKVSLSPTFIHIRLYD